MSLVKIKYLTIAIVSKMYNVLVVVVGGCFSGLACASFGLRLDSLKPINPSAGHVDNAVLTTKHKCRMIENIMTFSLQGQGILFTSHIISSLYTVLDLEGWFLRQVTWTIYVSYITCIDSYVNMALWAANPRSLSENRTVWYSNFTILIH